MDDIKKFIAGSIITLVVGGTAYSFTQEDVVNNFANDTGVTQEQAEQYVSDISEDELFSWDEIGNEMIIEGEEFVALAAETDCVNYEYEWETITMPCPEGKSQMSQLGRNTISLGESYVFLESDGASSSDMKQTVSRIDALNNSYDLEVVTLMYEPQDIVSIKQTNSYNKAVLTSAIKSEE